MYLGKLFCFQDMHDLELNNREGKAWSEFGMCKAELMDRRFDLKMRTKLFKDHGPSKGNQMLFINLGSCVTSSFIWYASGRIARAVLRAAS